MAPADKAPPVQGGPADPVPEAATAPEALPLDVSPSAGVFDPTPAEEDADPDPPVYDERGNVRPRGTPGARAMTKAERTEIARKLAKGEVIQTTSERPLAHQAKVRDQEAKAAKAKAKAK